MKKTIIPIAIIIAVFALGFSGCGWFGAAEEETPPQLSLSTKTWNWVSATTADGEILIPDKPDIFSLTFTEDGRVSVGTDCNSMGGQYTAADNSLVFTEMMSTLMYCEGSQEQEFSALLGLVSGYRFTDEGELVLSSNAEPDLITLR